MPLSTSSDIPFTSPLKKPDANAVPSSQVTLTDVSAQGVIDIRGRTADQALKTLYDAVPGSPGSVTLTRDGALACLRPDQFTLLLNNGANRDALDALDGMTVTITDVTHGRAIMRLTGEKAPSVLPKICGLNFADAAFPNLHAAQTSLAKVRALIVRSDRDSLPAYYLVVDRSLGAYVWGVVDDAAQEFRAG